ncbi:mitochondrial carrier protein-related [Schistosoma mansoni]|uniref:Mitochondrial carrier protein-related n=1 Tax=Schistosoma mansoni TaxID=6183 RepID=A0AA82MFL0_SCHMA|nr:mitochondrial carrier protein-related [Schistosoma mansoni]|eukprot:XP_018644963.1 mitochondrial carrier protein-related [Schistosoma mansoni]
MPGNLGNFEVIELSMLKKHMFFPLSGLGNFTAQTLLYPFVLLRTRLQLQEGAQVYRGLVHAISSVVKEEGFRGLYSGYLVRSFHIFSGTIYVSTYEVARQACTVFPTLSPIHRSFVGGAVASCVAQGFFVPIDVVSQHLMVVNCNRIHTNMVYKNSNLSSNPHRFRPLTPVHLTENEMNSNWGRLCGVIRYIKQTHGLKGFYKGCLISMCTFVPSSALWWSFYDKFCGLIHFISKKMCKEHVQDSVLLPSNDDSAPVPRLLIQLISAPLAGISSAIIVNPLDVVRVRMQVSHIPFKQSVIHLWQFEGIRWFSKGLSARLIQTTFHSFWVVLVYEPMKLFCLKDDYRNKFSNV